MKRKQLHDGTHLTLDERKIIQAGIENGSTKAAIARTIGKDATTVAKEIRRHRTLKPRNMGMGMPPCVKKPHCTTANSHIYRKCMRCRHYEAPGCRRRDKSPGACNKCPKNQHCRLPRYFYNAEFAHEHYKQELVDARLGVNLTTDERANIAEIISPLLAQGQSVHQILCAHPEITQCEKTIYTYIGEGIFKPEGVDNFSLKEKVNRKPRKLPKIKKRKEPVNYTGRTYADFLRFRDSHPDIPIVEMDTLYNTPGGPYLQTLLFTGTAFMIGFLHQERTSASMAKSFDVLQQRLGNTKFEQLLSVVLADRGSEFEKMTMFELDSNEQTRLNMFYCDPMQASQKPHVENNHNYVRDIIPNGYPMDALSQADINLMFSHINSTPRRSIGGKSPFEVFSFIYGEDTPGLLNVKYIPRDEVVLKPFLIFAKRAK